MKYNIKIKKILFASFVAIIFCLPINDVLAASTIVCGDVDRLGLGECEYGECDEGYSKDFNGSYDCQDNWFDTTCCVLTSGGVAKSPKSNATPVGSDSLPVSPYDCWDKNDPTIGGNCQMTSCSAGSVKLTGGCEDNWFQKTCCRVDDGSGATPISASGLSGLGQTPINNSSGGGTNVNNTGVNNNNSASSGTAPIVALPSQCMVGQIDGEAQGLCDTSEASNAKILAQCRVFYPGASICNTMQSYLNAMQKDCLEATATGQVTGTDCMAISKGGIYGREASKFASYLASKVPSNGGAGANNSAGGLDFDSIARTGIPDSPNVKVVLVNIVSWMLEILGLITFIAFIISGGQYLMASGNDKMIETAKKNMTYSVIGIIVALSGFVIIRAVDMALRATSRLF